MTNILTFDVECTTSNKGNPFDNTNHLVNVGWKLGSGNVSVEYHNDNIICGSFPANYLEASIIVGFNLKFDIAWVRRVFNMVPSSIQRVFDCQLAYYILTNQKNPYPSLNEVAAYYGLGKKIDVIKEEYWGKGVDTDQIPRDILTEYLKKDVELTYQIYQCQQEQLKDSPKRKLISLSNMDLLVLHEMEWNGMKYDVENSLAKANTAAIDIVNIDNKLTDLVGVTGINWGSGDQLSCVLYGGTIKQEYKEDFIFTYKNTKTPPTIKQRKAIKEIPMPRLVEPLKRSALKKEGFFSTDASTLQKVPADGKAKKIIKLVSERSKLDKLVGTYYRGLPEKIGEMHWGDELIHPNLNQCTAVTGRLSCTKPNLQNIAAEVQPLFITRY